MVTELEQHKSDQRVVNGVDSSTSEWPIVGEVPHSSVDFVAVPGTNGQIRQQVQAGVLEIIAENSDKHPDWAMVVRRAIKPAVIAAGGIVLAGVITIGVYTLYKDPKVEKVAAEMREKLLRKRQLPY